MFLEMRLRQLKVALLVPDDSLLRIALAKKYFSEQSTACFSYFLQKFFRVITVKISFLTRTRSFCVRVRLRSTFVRLRSFLCQVPLGAFKTQAAGR